MRELIYSKYKEHFSKDCIDINYHYFEALYKKYVNNEAVDLVMNDGGNRANCFPLPIVSKNDLSEILVQDYEDLSDEPSSRLNDFTLEVCKMQAGLGTSVKREDLLEKYTSRKKLGAKGTDLFINYEGKMTSIAEAQLLLAEKFLTDRIVGKVRFKNLVNDETKEAVEDIWKLEHPFKAPKTYKDVFSTNELSVTESINQLLMPTIDDKGSITFDREAPGGHAFLGFHELVNLFEMQEVPNELCCIGNGEDLRSNPDKKILSWMVERDIPIVMITTTKLEKDKKGGQIALVKQDGMSSYVTIVEKAQAEKANQLSYFEELGLRPGDGRSLFNTNIVLFNKKVLKEYFKKFLNIDKTDFYRVLAPDLIKNVKEQNGRKYIQLEGAIGSTLLNLDKYFRINYNQSLVHFLNLAPENREKFFLPIKKRSDFDEIYQQN